MIIHSQTMRKRKREREKAKMSRRGKRRRRRGGGEGKRRKRKSWRTMELCEVVYVKKKWKRLENILYSEGKTLEKREN